MSKWRRIAYAAALVLLPLAGSCATAPEGSVSSIRVEVRNDLIPSTALTIYVVPESGVRRLIGTVDPSQTATLEFEEVAVGQYRLVARTTAGGQIVSNPITLADVAALEWDLSSNILTVSESRS